MEQKIEKIFVFIALIFGFLYVFILPPFQSVDEGNHFFRAYQISEGKFVSKNFETKEALNVNNQIGDYLPSSLLNYHNKYTCFIKNINKKQNFENIKMDFKTKINSNNKVFISFANTSLYSPVCYIGSLTGLIPAKYFTDNIAIIYYIGRLSNLLLYCLLVFWALRVIPFYKLPLMLLALCPMSLSLGSSYTSDITVLGLNFLWIAYILKFICENHNDIKKAVILSILAFLITLSKSYILILPLCFLIPPKQYKNIKSYIISMLLIILSILAGGLIWYSVSKGLTLNMNNTIADPNGQIAFIKSNPIIYIWIMIKTFIIKIPRLIITMIGVLGWQDTKLDWSTYILYPVIVYFSLFSDTFKFEFFKWQKYLIAATIFTGIILTFTSLYVMWTPVGNGLIQGLNGKYFIPLMLPLFLLFKKEIPKYDYKTVSIFVIVTIILILFTSELSLLHRFYDITPQLYYKI